MYMYMYTYTYIYTYMFIYTHTYIFGTDRLCTRSRTRAFRLQTTGTPTCKIIIMRVSFLLFNGFPVVNCYQKPLKAIFWPSIILWVSAMPARCHMHCFCLCAYSTNMYYRQAYNARKCLLCVCVCVWVCVLMRIKTFNNNKHTSLVIPTPQKQIHTHTHISRCTHAHKHTRVRMWRFPYGA